MASADVWIYQRRFTCAWSCVSAVSGPRSGGIGIWLRGRGVEGGADDNRPQYWEIYKLRQVIGISLFFLSVDILGGIFSFLSLFFREDLDIAAFVRIFIRDYITARRPQMPRE